MRDVFVWLCCSALLGRAKEPFSSPSVLSTGTSATTNDDDFSSVVIHSDPEDDSVDSEGHQTPVSKLASPSRA